MAVFAACWGPREKGTCMPVRIITDSGSDLTSDFDPQLTVLPLSIAFGTTTYQDGVDLTREHFYELLVDGDELPTTGQVTPYAFSQALEAARAAGEDALIVTLSSKLSGTYQSAVTAAADFPGTRVVDSMNATIGEGILVQYALRLAGQGLSVDEIADKLDAATGRVCLVALLDTLEYLRRGGRIPAAASALGKLLAVKPVIGVVDGEAVMLGKARGSKNGRNLLRQEVEKAGGVDVTMPVSLGYSGVSKKLLEQYIDDNRELWEGVIEKDELPIVLVGATVGTHAGPNAIALAFFRKQ